MRTRRVIIFSLALSMLVVLQFAPTAHAYEHIRNGGFESGVDGWSARPHSPITPASREDVPPFEGAASAKVTLLSDRFEVSQTLDQPLAAGTYALTAQLRTPDDGLTVTLDVRGASVETASEVELTANTWTFHASLINVPSATASITIAFVGRGQRGDTLYLDAVQLDGAPPITFTPTATVGDSTATMTPAASPSPLAPTPQPTPAVTDTIADAIRNASFEDVTLDGLPFAWHKFGGEIASTASPRRTGGRAIRFESRTASTKWLYQLVLVDPGASYAFAAWVWHDDPNVRSASLRVSWYESTDASGESIGSDEAPSALAAPAAGFRYVTTGSITAPPTARSARLRVLLSPISAAPATIYVDDVEFDRASPPVPTATAPAASTERPAATGRTTTLPALDRSALRSSTDSVDRYVATSTDSASLTINEILYDPDGDRPDADAEWVEIYNSGSESVSLAGWALRDGARSVLLPEILIPPRDFAIVAASDSFLPEYESFDGVVAWIGGRIGNGLGNDADLLELVEPSGAVVDAVAWGARATNDSYPVVDDVPAGHSIERRVPGFDTDQPSDFMDNEEPSPGQALELGKGDAKGAFEQGAVEILDASSEGRFAWAPWALVAISGAALAGTIGWRTVDTIRDRTRGT